MNRRLMNPWLCRLCVGIGMAWALTHLSGDVSAQEKKGASLSFIHPELNAIMIFRPAQMMASKDYRLLRSIGGKTVEKLVERMTDQYFNMCGADIDEVDSIINATFVPDPETGMQGYYNVNLIRTQADNALRFDMVTQDVKQEVQYRGQTYFVMKKRINYMDHCYIADERTIVWGNSKLAMERTIEASQQGPASTPWYKMWKERLASKDIGLIVGSNALSSTPPVEPYNKLRNCQYMLGGIDAGSEIKGVMYAVCDSPVQAREMVQTGEAMVQQGLTTLEMEGVNSEERFQGAIKIATSALKSIKIDSEGKIVVAKGACQVDFNEILPLIKDTQVSASRTQSMNNIRQIAIAMHNYHDANKSFPPAVLTHASGKRYSWRIAVLPYMERSDIYDEYDFTQDWNSPHNRKVTADMPDFYRAGDEPSDSTNACYFVLTGHRSAFSGEHGVGLQEITDGTSNTILAVESRQNIHWAEPRDIPLDRKNFRLFGGFFPGGFNAAFCDGHVSFIQEDVDPDKLFGLMTINGGEVIREADLRK